ncbi:hypothetical protein FRC07_014769 [Ceratobasidium sp. 392]|nr:hypothetical protein FRC07_014769 [Ceratobasidium sp. 392]
MRFSLAIAAGVVHFAAGAASVNSVDQTVTEDVAPGAYIVELKPGSHLKRGFSSPHAELYHDLERRGVVWDVQKEYTGELLTGAAVTLGSEADLAKLAQANGVQSITPVYIYPPPNITDTRANESTGSTPANENAAAHTRTGVAKLHGEGRFGKGVTIAILDTGIDYTHPALGGKFGPGNKVAGGFDFVGDAFTARKGSPPPIPDSDPLSQCNGHGTHVAGIIGANPNNPHNISGVAYEATINAYRIFGCQGSTNDVILVDALNKAYEDGNDIINLSLGAPDAWAKSASSLVASRIVAKGRIVTFAAGNDGAFGGWYTATGSGVISVGNAEKLSGVGAMSVGSTWGPSNDMFMNPSVSAPGTNILSTWPVTQGSYQVHSGTSMAAPFAAGSAALLLQVRGRNEATAKSVLGMFQNTAIPVPGSGAGGNLLESAAHQGAGLIQVYDAIKGTGSMLPAELLLNDTAHFQGSHEVSVKNDGNQTVTYSLAHVATGTSPTMSNGQAIFGPQVSPIEKPASVSISPSSVTVAAGQSLPVKIEIKAPAGADPKQFPIFSGFIEAKGSDGTLLRTTYLGVAASLKDMPVIATAPAPSLKNQKSQAVSENATFTLSGADFPSIVYSLTSGTPLLLVDLVNLLPAAAIDPRRLYRFARKPITVKRANPEDTFAGLEVVGRVFRREYLTRNKQFFSMGHSVQQFTNGTAIPDGNYKILLRALKITGDAAKEEDWEHWTSPIITVKRSPEAALDGAASGPGFMLGDFWLTQLRRQAGALSGRFIQTGNLADAQAAIDFRARLLSLMTQDHPDTPVELSRLAFIFMQRFEVGGSLADLDKALETQRCALNLPDGGRHKLDLHSVLGIFLQRRFERLGQASDLEEAITYHKYSFLFAADDHEELAIFASNLGGSLASRFALHSGLCDINEAIQCYQLAILTAPDSHPEKPKFLNNLGLALRNRSKRTLDMAGFDEAIKHQQHAMALTSNTLLGHTKFLNDLGVSFKERFERSDNLPDIDAAIDCHQRILSSLPKNHSEVTYAIQSLGAAFESRFERTNDISDLNKAIDHSQQAVLSAPDDNPEKSEVRLTHLGNMLAGRFKRFGNLNDINEAIECYRRASSISSDNRSMALSNLGFSLYERFGRVGDLVDLDGAIEYLDQVANLLPDGNPRKAALLSNLGLAYERTSEHLDSSLDLEKAIGCHQQAILLALQPGEKSGYLNNLGLSLARRFDRSGDPADIDKAIESYKEAIPNVSNGHLRKIGLLDNLGVAYGHRFRYSRQLEDIDQSIHYQE